MPENRRSIAVIGLGYVGLPAAVAFASRHPSTIGFDIDEQRIAELRSGNDRTGEVEPQRLRESSLRVTHTVDDLAGSDFFVVTVPTPIDSGRRPNLDPLRAASRTVGSVLKKGAIVVYESTVYPGVTEDVCGPILEEVSGLTCGVDFTLGYSPERINPGDKEHTFERIIKVVSGQDEATLDAVAEVYGSVITAGVHRCPSIQAAEAAKVIENTQRDLNIALMNELSIIFDRIGLDTKDVLDAAGTKWNFLPFTPGLVGGHCIGVDPYYLTAKAEQVGVHPEVILAGRRVNDGMGEHVAHRTIKELIAAGCGIHESRVLVIGVTFKENIPDIRNSRVPGIVSALQEFGIDVEVFDPWVDPDELQSAYGIGCVAEPTGNYDAVVLAVPHTRVMSSVRALLEAAPPRVFVDVKSAWPKADLPATTRLWRL